MYQHLHWIVRMCVVRVSCQEEKRQQKREIKLKSIRLPVSENGTVGIEFSQWGRSNAQVACYQNTVNLEKRSVVETDSVTPPCCDI